MNKIYLEHLAKALTPVLYYSGVHALTKPLYSGVGHILMFHRVLPESSRIRVHNHKTLEITPAHLEEIINFFKQLDYQFISLDELERNQRAPEPKKKFVVFTFDDGYADNYTHAYPIFKKHGIPFTIYVATSMPDGNAVLWWYLLEDLIAEHSTIEGVVNGQKKIFFTNTTFRKEIAFNQIRSLFVRADKKALSLLMRDFFKDHTHTIYSKTTELALSWQQIVELSQDPLVTIGSHTVNHLPLHSLTLSDAQEEIRCSREIIESHVHQEVRHFCYPFGSYGTKEIHLLKEGGYSTATTVNMANIFNTHSGHPFSLPRIMINSLTNTKLLTLQINGLLPALRNKFRRVLV
jgi:peptidoglycan/xylan/chitin deacetylase (PgdA/CDA1 family)